MLANALEVGRAGLVVLGVVAQPHRQQTELRRQRLKHRRGHPARVRQKVAAPAQGAELHAEAQLVDRSAAAGDLVQVGPRQAEVLAQLARTDLGREPLGDVVDRGRPFVQQ